jgi:hypothetical protein
MRMMIKCASNSEATDVWIFADDCKQTVNRNKIYFW